MKKIGVIGSINMDLTALSERIPSPGETVSAKELKRVPGGKGANQAVAAARLGACVSMFGCVGDDVFAGELLDNLRQNRVDTSGIERVQGTSSGVALIVVSQGENAITVVPGANARVSPEYIRAQSVRILENDIVLLQNEIPLETVYAAAKMLHENGKTVIYNPAPALKADKKLLDLCSFITPNEHEVRLLCGNDSAPIEQLVESAGGRLIVTLGSKGVIGCDSEGLFAIPAIDARVTDTTGAGDTLNGAFACALSLGMGVRDALIFANAAAGISTEKYGAQGGMPGMDEVLARIKY